MWNSETEHPDITWGHRCWKWKTESVVKRDKEKNIMCLQKKNVTFEWNRGKSVYTQRDADHRPAPKEEHLASDCGKTVLWLGWLTKKLIKNYTPFFFSPSILLLIIYSSSKYTCNVEKGTLFEITDLLNPCFFCNYINSFWNTSLVSLSQVMLRRHLKISTS